MRRGAAVSLRPKSSQARAVPRHGGGPSPPTATGPPLSSGRIAIAMLIAAETMFFTGLIGAYVVLRGSSVEWPPPGQPRLPIGVTWVNTAVLFASCFTMRRAVKALGRRAASDLLRALVQTAALGSTFLVIQGTEWVRLLRFGLTVSSGLYGATFYTLIGLHATHVLAAVVWLLWVTARFRGRRFSLGRAVAVDLCGIYWYYVCGLWAILFPLVYLF